MDSKAKTKQVKQIYDIPGIENMLDYVFKFGSYDINDRIKSYTYKKGYPISLTEDLEDVIEICIISDESTILSEEYLKDLITEHNIYFLSMNWYKYILDEDDQYTNYELKKGYYYTS